MTCSDIQEVLPELLDVPADGMYPSDLQSHLKHCPECAELVSELRTITGEARYLAGSDEPSPLLWLRISAQLRAEGLIREQEPELAVKENPERMPVRTFPRPRWSFSWLVPVAAVLLVVGTYLVRHPAAPIVSQRKTPVIQAPSSQASVSQSPNQVVVNQAQNAAQTAVPETPVARNSATPPLPSSASNASSPSVSSDSRQLAQRSGSTARTDMEESAPSADDQQFLSVVSTLAPAMKASYEQQLQVVNADIRESQAYVDQNPGDADARQHLMEAYQQKALLYQIALDRIQ